MFDDEIEISYTEFQRIRKHLLVTQEGLSQKEIDTATDYADNRGWCLPCLGSVVCLPASSEWGRPAGPCQTCGGTGLSKEKEMKIAPEVMEFMSLFGV